MAIPFIHISTAMICGNVESPMPAELIENNLNLYVTANLCGILFGVLTAYMPCDGKCTDYNLRH